MRTRGIVNSVELLLILTVVVAISLMTIFYLSRSVTAQASSPKPLVSISSGKVYLIKQGTTCKQLVVTLYITNEGSVPITVSKFGVIDAAAKEYTSSNSIKYTVNPGETRILSDEITLNSCPTLTSSTNSNTYYVYAYIEYSADNRDFTVGRNVPVITIS